MTSQVAVHQWLAEVSNTCVMPLQCQVYRGRLASTGEEVAVKVQRPGIGENIAIDMVLLRRLMTAFDVALPRLNLPIQVRGSVLQANRSLYLVVSARRCKLHPSEQGLVFEVFLGLQCLADVPLRLLLACPAEQERSRPY